MLDALILRRRQARFAAMLRYLPTKRPLRVLDVGGTVDYWLTMPWQALQPCAITLLNVFPQEAPKPFTAVVGDARDLSRYPDQSFDVVLSHSVIGHVGDWTDQQQMARELQRVGRVVILQTPNHYFPIDWRTLIPAFHWLPVSTQQWCLDRFRVGRYPKGFSANHVRNLNRRELTQLFPRATVQHERVGGFTKSFTVVQRDQLHVPTPRP